MKNLQQIIYKSFIFKVLSVFLCTLIFVNGITYANDTNTSCLQTPSFFNSPCAIKKDNLTNTYKILSSQDSWKLHLHVFLWFVIAESYEQGLSEDEIKELVSSVITERVPKGYKPYFIWDSIRYQDGKIAVNSITGAQWGFSYKKAKNKKNIPIITSNGKTIYIYSDISKPSKEKQKDPEQPGLQRITEQPVLPEDHQIKRISYLERFFGFVKAHLWVLLGLGISVYYAFFCDMPDHGNVSYAMAFFVTGVSGEGSIGKDPQENPRKYISRIRKTIRQSGDIQKKIADPYYDHEKVSLEILSILGIPAVYLDKLMNIIVVEIERFLNEKNSKKVKPSSASSQSHNRHQHRDPLIYTEVLAFQKAARRSLQKTLARFFEEKGWAVEEVLKDEKSINSILELVLSEDRASVILAENYVRYAQVHTKGLILGALRDMKNKDRPQLNNKLKILGIVSGAIVFLALTGLEPSVVNLIVSLMVSFVLFLPGWVIHEIGHYIGRDFDKDVSMKMKGGPLASFALTGLTFFAMIFLSDNRILGLPFWVIALTAITNYLYHVCADNMAMFQKREETFGIDQEDINSVLKQINRPLQFALLEGTQKEVLINKKESIKVNEYPFVCLYASIVCKRILEKYFGDSIKKISIVEGKGNKDAVTKYHVWLEVKLENGKKYYLSLVDGQFQQAFTGSKVESFFAFDLQTNKRYIDEGVDPFFSLWALMYNMEYIMFFENRNDSMHRYLTDMGIRKLYFSKKKQERSSRTKADKIFQIFLEKYRQEKGLAAGQKDHFLVAMEAQEEPVSVLSYSLWETIYGKEKAKKVAPLYEETGWGAVALLQSLLGQKIGFKEWLRNIFLALELFVASRTFAAIINIIALLVSPESFFTVFSVVITSNACAFALLHHNKDLKDFCHKYNAGIILNLINMVFPVVGPTLAHRVWNDRFANKGFYLMVSGKGPSALQLKRAKNIRQAIERIQQRKKPVLATRIAEELQSMHTEDTSVEVLSLDQILRSVKVNNIKIQSMAIDAKKRRKDIKEISSKYEKEKGVKPTVKETIAIILEQDPLSTINYQNLMKWIEQQGISIEDLGMRNDKAKPEDFLDKVVGAAQRISERTGSKKISSSDLRKELNTKASAFSQRLKRARSRGNSVEAKLEENGFEFVVSTGMGVSRKRKIASLPEKPSITAEEENEVSVIPVDREIQEENPEKRTDEDQIDPEKKEKIKQTIKSLLTAMKVERIIDILPKLLEQYTDKDYSLVAIATAKEQTDLTEREKERLRQLEAYLQDVIEKGDFDEERVGRPKKKRMPAIEQGVSKSIEHKQVPQNGKTELPANEQVDQDRSLQNSGQDNKTLKTAEEVSKPVKKKKTSKKTGREKRKIPEKRSQNQGFAAGVDPKKKKSAKISIENLLSNFRGRRLIQIMPLIQRRFSDSDYIRVAVEMIEEEDLSKDDREYVETVKQKIEPGKQQKQKKGTVQEDVESKKDDTYADVTEKPETADNKEKEQKDSQDHPVQIEQGTIEKVSKKKEPKQVREDKKLKDELRRKSLFADEKEEIVSCLLWALDISETHEAEDVRSSALLVIRRLRKKLKEIFVKEKWLDNTDESMLSFFQKDQRLAKHYESTLYRLFYEQKQGYIQQNRQPKSVILYADDIIENAVVFDLQATLKLLSREGGLLHKGKIFLYHEKCVDFKQVYALKEYIQSASKDIQVIIVDAEDVQDKTLEKDVDAGEQLEKLLRYLKRRDCDGDRMPELIEKDVIAVIKSNDASIIDLYGRYDHEIPVILMNGRENGLFGIFSFSHALCEALLVRKSNGQRGWIKILDAVDDTDTQYKYYCIYRDEVLTSL